MTITKRQLTIKHPLDCFASTRISLERWRVYNKRLTHTWPRDGIGVYPFQANNNLWFMALGTHPSSL